MDAPDYFDRPSLYAEDGTPYGDDAERFAFFSRAVADLASRTDGPPVDVVHVHDWHAALVPTYLHRAGASTPTVLTIHNLAYQGDFPLKEVPAGLEHLVRGERFNFLGAGILEADAVTTVSPSYAAEITTPAFGAGVDELLRARPSPPLGILNGIDVIEWDPGTDAELPMPYRAADLSGKAAARTALIAELGLSSPDDDPIVAVVSRFAAQKGIDLVTALEPEDIGIRIIALGEGDPPLEEAMRQMAARYPERVAVRLGWDKRLAHLLIAGADLVALPSRFEPCGLVQMQAMRYGTIPVAHAVGGLRDSVLDPGDEALMEGRGTGFLFVEPTTEALAAALRRAVRLFRSQPEGWRRLQETAMARDWSWETSAGRYLDLYRSLGART